MVVMPCVDSSYFFFSQVIQEAIDVSHEKNETLKLASKASALTQPVCSHLHSTRLLIGSLNHRAAGILYEWLGFWVQIPNNPAGVLEQALTPLTP